MDVKSQIAILRQEINDAEQEFLRACTPREEKFWEEKLEILRQEKLRLLGHIQLQNIDKEIWDELLMPLSKEEMCTTLDTEVLERILLKPLRCKIPALTDGQLVSDCPEIFKESSDVCAWGVYSLLSSFSRMTWAEAVATSFYDVIVVGLVNVLKVQYGLSVSVDNKVDPERRTRYIRASLNSVPLLFGKYNNRNIDKKLWASSACVYGDLQYIFGYEAEENTARLFIFPLDADKNPLQVQQKLNMNDKRHRQSFVIAVINICRWMRTISEHEIIRMAGLPLLKDHMRQSPWKYCDVEKAGAVTIHIGLNHVRKVFRIPSSVFEGFRDLYWHLHEGLEGAVHANVFVNGKELFKENTSFSFNVDFRWLNIELHLVPVGCQVDYDMDSELVVCMVKTILHCLEKLHGLGFCHYDVRLCNVIQYKNSFLLSDFDMAGRIHSEVPGFRSRYWKPGCSDTYVVANDLYMVAKYLIYECKWSPEFLKELAGRLLSGEISSASEALKNFQNI